MPKNLTKSAYYVLFTLSGFAGLVYETVWSHYLKLILGHAAYSQALVIIIFMGGMAGGAWITSRLASEHRNLLLHYAFIELVIGLFGAGFDPAFQEIYSITFTNILPALDNPVLIQSYKFLVTSLLILPQSLLLGATFPLMTEGFIRKFPKKPGQSISLLYFYNSLGAAIAALVSAFYLIGTLGISGTIFTSGMINIFIAALVFCLSKNDMDTNMSRNSATMFDGSRLLLFVSFLTGLSSFIYEVTWIRMLSLVLGASTYAFELMLSAFITGLAIGGYFISKYLDSIARPAFLAAIIQVVMGVFAIITIFLYGYSFEMMSFFMAAIDETYQGYYLFSLFSHSIALAIMLPTTVCAGMTLPILTYILLEPGKNNKCIGQVYASNTLGGIIGVLFTVFVGLPVFGLKGALLTGALIDISLGLILFNTFTYKTRLKSPVLITVVILFVAICLVTPFKFNYKMLASGVFRHGSAELDDKTSILFHKDGKTASVTVSEWDHKKITIMTNGKPDAAITMDINEPPSIDEATMTLLAALPLSIYPEARTIANIGMGSGLTAHTVLAMPGIERIDTIEIEKEIINGAKYFQPETERIFKDSRSHIHIDDARTYFSTQQIGYDIIISEPSNPWVSGVSSLFTTEFYTLIRTHLNTGGLMVQWIHMYELNMEILVSVLKAISENFSYFQIYFADDGDLILLASESNPIKSPHEAIFGNTTMKNQLARVHVHNIDDLRFRYLGDQSLYKPFINTFPIKTNSDYYPVLDLQAERSRFLRDSISELLNMRLSPVPILDILYSETGYRTLPLSPNDYFSTQNSEEAKLLFTYFSNKVFDKSIVEDIAKLNYLLASAVDCNNEFNYSIWVDSFFMMLNKFTIYLAPDQMDKIINAITPKCKTGIQNSNILRWIELLSSLRTNNYILMRDTLVELLEPVEQLDPEQRKNLMTWLLVTLVKTGEYSKVEILWKEFMAEMYPNNISTPLEIRILLAIANVHI